MTKMDERYTVLQWVDRLTPAIGKELLRVGVQRLSSSAGADLLGNGPSGNDCFGVELSRGVGFSVYCTELPWDDFVLALGELDFASHSATYQHGGDFYQAVRGNERVVGRTVEGAVVYSLPAPSPQESPVLPYLEYCGTILFHLSGGLLLGFAVADWPLQTADMLIGTEDVAPRVEGRTVVWRAGNTASLPTG